MFSIFFCGEDTRGTIFSLLNPTGIPRRIIETDLPSLLTFLQPDIPRFSGPNQPSFLANLAPSQTSSREKIGRIRVSRTYYQRDRSTFIWISRRLGDRGFDGKFWWPVGRRVKGDEIPPLNMFINNFPPARLHDRPVSRCLLDKRPVKDHTRLLVKFFLLSSFLGDYARIRPANLLSFVLPNLGIYLLSYFHPFFLLMLQREVERFYADRFGKW